jgi:hypothetical protein
VISANDGLQDSPLASLTGTVSDVAADSAVICWYPRLDVMTFRLLDI